MQAVGRECAVCKRRVQAATEGAWCTVCASAFHRACIAARDICPSCHTSYLAPEQLAVDTRLCTKCLRLHPQPVDACGACGTRMRFDDATELEQRTREILRFARSQMWQGVALLAGGAGLYTAAAMWFAPLLTGMAGGALAIMYGARKVWVGRRLRHFG
jgi:hypothetical protein